MLQHAGITWDENDLPRAREFGDIYFSADDPFGESEHVFLVGNALPARMATLTSRPLVIGECGFGFGLNVLLACARFCALAPASARMNIISSELYPVSRHDLQQFYRKLPGHLKTLAGQLLAQYPPPLRGAHRIKLQQDNRSIILDIILDDAQAAFHKINLPEPGIDAWFLDGFAPDRNAAMWHSELCHILASCSHDKTTLATYSVAGTVRRNLAAAGFDVSRQPGFGGKRHMLTGRFTGKTTRPSSTVLSWHNPRPAPDLPITSVAVIGAGLAGCATAHTLALRGLDVTLVEKHATIASGSSGNVRGIVHMKLSLGMSPASRFRQLAFQFAIRHYQALSNAHDFGWQPDGVIQLGIDEKEQLHQQALYEKRHIDTTVLQQLTTEAASRTAGLVLSHGGLFMPQAGSLNPVSLCQAWITPENISVVTETEATHLEQANGKWLVSLSNSQGASSRSFDAVVICTNTTSSLPDVLPAYPCLCNHGQADTYTLGSNFPLPETILCHQGYCIPWLQDGMPMVMIGGSYAEGRHTSGKSDELHARNLALLERFAPSVHTALLASAEHTGARIGTRLTTPDYLPLAGPVEHTSHCRDIYAAYQRNARQKIHARANYMPGLYINLAHGSSGLTHIPVLAEYLASLICQEALPLADDVIPAIHPLRFLIRALKRQKLETGN